MTAAADERRQVRRPGPILFSLLHAGYLRHYAEPIVLLAERGYAIHLAIGQPDRDPKDGALLDAVLASAPGITASYGPDRSPFDGWRRLAWLVRGLTDLTRYAHPRYEHSNALRARARATVVDRIAGGAPGSVGGRVATWVVRRLETGGAESVKRNLRGLAVAEASIPPSRRHLALMRRLEPVAVFASPVVELASPQVEFVKAAQALGIPTGVCVASWDNLTNKGMLRVPPDRLIVWNEAQRHEAAEIHGIDPSTVVTTGAQKFDEWFRRRPSTSREDFLARAGLPADQPYLLYVGSSPFIASNELAFVERWLAALRAAGRPLAIVGVLVRPHPHNSGQWRDWQAPADVSVWPRRGEQPDEGEARAQFFDSLWHSALVVGVNTSALIEAGVVGKRVYTVLDPQFAETQEGTLHFQHLLRDGQGFLRAARTLDEHVGQVAEALREGEAGAERTRAFVAEFVRPHGLEKSAAPMVADALAAVAALGQRPPARVQLRARLLRLALLPLALVSAVAAVATRGRRLSV